MRVEQLDYFLAVARYGSISQAANNLFIGQPTLSAAITSLEKELDTKLFKRTKAGMELTPMGVELIPLAEKAIDDFYAIKKKAAKKVITKSHIHVACDASASNMVITDVIRRSKALFPEVNLHVHELLPAEVLRHVIEGHATIGIGSAADYILPKHQEYADDLSLILKPLYRDEICFCCSAQSDWAKTPTVSFDDLLDEQVALPESLVYQGIFKHPNCYQDFTNLCTFSNAESVKRAALSGDFVAMLPRQLILGDGRFEGGALKALKLVNHSTSYIQYLTYCKEHPLTDVEKELLELIESSYSALVHPCDNTIGI